jgi:hypothetical protein
VGLTETLRLVISGDSSGAIAALSETADAAAKSNGVFGKYGSGLNTAANFAAAGVVGLGAVIGKSVYDTQKSYSAIKELMRMTGDTAAEASTLTGQWDATGLSIEEGSVAMKKFSQNLAAVYNGTAKANPFGELGVSVKDANGGMRDSAAVLADVQAKMSALDNPTQRTAVAIQMFGKSGDDLLSWLTKTPAELDALNKKIADAGLIWSDKDIAAYAEAAAASRDLKIALTGIEKTIATDVVPQLTKMVEVVVWGTEKLGPFAKAIPYITVALAAFVGIVKGAQMVQGAWVATFGKLIARAGGSAAAIGVETAAIEANTAAKVENALAGGGSVAGIGRGALPLGAAGGGLATGAGLIAPGVALAAAAVATGFLAEWARSGDVSQNVKNMNAAGVRTQGRMAGSVAQSDALDAANAAKMAPVNQAWSEFAAIAQIIKDAKPGAGQVGALARYKDALTRLEKKYPVVAEQSDKLKGSLDKSADAFDAASQAADAAAESIRTAFTSMADFMKATATAAIMGTPLPTAAQAAFASQSSQAAASAALTDEQRLQMYNANRKRLGLSTISGHAAGYVAPKKSTASKARVASSGGGVTIHINGPVVGGKAGLRELGDIISRQLGRQVRLARA